MLKAFSRINSFHVIKLLNAHDESAEDESSIQLVGDNADSVLTIFQVLCYAVTKYTLILAFITFLCLLISIVLCTFKSVCVLCFTWLQDKVHLHLCYHDGPVPKRCLLKLFLCNS